MDIIKEGEDLKERKDPDKVLESMLRSWRASEHYAWVHKILDTEIERSYAKEIIASKMASGEPLDKEEIGNAMILEVQSASRIEAIKEVLK